MFAEDDLTIRRLEVPELWKWKKGLSRLCFFFPKQGRGVYRDSQISRAFSAGDVLVLNTGVKGSIEAQGREKLAGVIFHAFLEHLGAVFTINEFCLLERASKTYSGPWYYPAGSKLAMKCRALVDGAPEELGVEHRCHLLKIAAAILSEEFKRSQSKCNGNGCAGNGSGRILDQLSLDEIQKASIDSLAKKYGCSRRHLNRLFHERFGISVSALKMEMRLLKALTLLRNPDSKVCSIAAECGFHHLSLFSARFRKRFGASPNQWREKLFATNRFALGSNGHICALQAKGLCPLPVQQGRGELGNECARGGAGRVMLGCRKAGGVK